MILMSVLVSIYYNVVVAWAILYLFILVTGRFSWWSTCAQDFNTPYCYSSLEDNRCTSLLNHGNNGSVIGFFFNGSCFDKSVSADVFDFRSTLFSEKGAVSPAEEFFENYVLEKSDSMEDIGGLNWKITICYAVAWGITAFALRKGVKLVGKLAR
uniref:Uncharacterized protein n=1 Tax=Panagrolaimus sp. JU765 TaxID=591449 RepID=A0AC34RJT1_9BILA